ncbi:hypothetical protein LEMLEM_LOCUS25923 [Lemmus lemmus]
MICCLIFKKSIKLLLMLRVTLQTCQIRRHLAGSHANQPNNKPPLTKLKFLPLNCFYSSPSNTGFLCVVLAVTETHSVYRPRCQ